VPTTLAGSWLLDQDDPPSVVKYAASLGPKLMAAQSRVDGQDTESSGPTLAKPISPLVLGVVLSLVLEHAASSPAVATVTAIPLATLPTRVRRAPRNRGTLTVGNPSLSL
jgi:hypothetical protein